MDKNSIEEQNNNRFWNKILKYKYPISILGFLIWITFFDSSSLLIIFNLKSEISKYEQQLEYYKNEYEKNNNFYNKLMNNKDEKERFARENYFMKKSNEDIFILVSDSIQIKK